MTTGERFTTSKVWEEGNKIRFSMQGLVVSVDKSEVAAIERSAKEPPPTASPPQVETKSSKEATPSEYPSLADPTMKPLKRPQYDNSTSAAERSRPHSFNRKGGNKGVGLDGISWRMSPKQLPGLKKVETDPAFGGIEQYYLPNQPMQFAGVPLDGLVYGFWQGQLYSVMMWAEGRMGYDRLRRGIFSIYGHGVQRKPEVERYVWDELTTQRMLEFDEKIKTGIFIMRSSELDAVIKERYPDR